MKFLNHKYLSEQQIKGFDKYKYSSVDSSPLSNYVSHPFWNWLVEFYPTWLAPNLITLVGFGCVMLAFLIVSFYDYYLQANSDVLTEGSIPNWVWLLCSICTFLGHTLDGTDGKQARRVGASGPTGELYIFLSPEGSALGDMVIRFFLAAITLIRQRRQLIDHGLDSWSTVPFTVTIFSIFGQGEFSLSAVRLLLVLISVQVVFIVSHWEKYNTGILYLSWGYDLSQYGLTLFYLFTYLKGYEYFKMYVFNGFTIAVCFEFGFYVCCYISLIVSTRNIYLSYTMDHTGKQDNLYEICLPLYPSTILFIISILWAIYSPGKVIERDPRLYLYTVGTVFSNTACRLIIAQMSSTRAETFNPSLAAYSCVAVISLLGLLSSYQELIILRFIAILLTLAHIHFGICVVRQLCEHFKIQAFSLYYLTKPPAVTQKKTENNLQQ